MKTIIDNIKNNYKLVIGTMIVGLFLGWLFFHPSDQTTENGETVDAHEGHDHESEDPTTWTCSMHPQIKQEKPGDCPICGMDLIPLSSMEESGDGIHEDEIMLTEAAAKLADIQTTVVERGSPEKDIYLQGMVEADERNMAELTARFGGRIEKLFVNFTGEKVQKGQKLATIYSPELVTAQRELLESVGLKESRPAIYKAARSKLKLWDLSESQIDDIEQQGEPKLYFDILAPISGTVMKRHVALGDYVKTGDALFRLVDLSKVWVMFDAYEADLPWIKPGDKMQFTVQSLPGEVFHGNVSYIDPFINPETRSAKVRIELNNKEGKLKPAMFANGVLHSSIAAEGNELLIPKSSILWTGKRAVVYVKVAERENPSFRYREILLGPEAGNFYVVAEGLEEGEEIATNGVFKIDAAAQLEGKPSMMNPVADEGRAGDSHDHSSMDMSGTGNETTGAKSEKIQPEMINASFKEQLTVVYHEYIDMKDAFVASDAAKVSKEANQMKEVLDRVDMELLEGAAHIKWMDLLKELDENTNSIINSKDIEIQRKAFSDFNLAFYKVVKLFGLKDIKTYYQYCPMANRDKGAYWFSNDEAIRNPYFGDAMLKCGENRETFQ